MDAEEPPCPSPYPPSASLLKDISNFKTPKRPSQIPNFQSPSPQFFTASKKIHGSSSFRRRPSLAPPSSARSKKSAAAARKLKAFELEQSQSSRKVQIKKEQSLKSLAKSLTVWLNFLFENPGFCGCDLSLGGDRVGDVGSTIPAAKGKRDGCVGAVIGTDLAWRIPKRQRNLWWRNEGSHDKENGGIEFPNSMFSYLRTSLEDVCSFDDLKQRMGVYLSSGSCKEIFKVMNQVTKNIDDGRLKMKPHCPIVTDVRLKEKATRILLCYNPIWLRIGLYIIFGGDSLVPKEDVDAEQEFIFLKMIIEKQFFSHAGLAKAYAYNKMVEGMYRPGYYESLGKVILKRILFLVVFLDRAKCQSCLPLKYGIDGLDGGSPLLFKGESCIKSSSQVVHEFLSSDVMHGEGNVLAHLVIVGYKVSHQQGPLVEYDFTVRDLFVDLQDGLRLCRAIQLLQHDSSILTKMVVPSDTPKKNLTNCGVALHFLTKAGVSLYDEDKMMIAGDDVANGDKELTLSLLWNMFVCLQLPLLVDKISLAEETSKIHGFSLDHLNNANSTPLEMLLIWIQGVCKSYDCELRDFYSLVDGKAIWCLLDYYFRKELHCSCSLKDPNRTTGEESIMSVADYPDAVHNFILSQKLTTLLGKFPEVLQISDLLEHKGACNDQSVVMLLVFLANQLFVKKNVDQLNFHKLLGCNCQCPERRHLSTGQCLLSSEVAQKSEISDGNITEDAARKFKAIHAWWRDMTEKNKKSVTKPAAPKLLHTANNCNIHIQKENSAAIIVQKFVRGWIARSRYVHGVDHRETASKLSQQNVPLGLKIQAAFKIQHHFSATKIQSYFRSWLLRKKFVDQVRAIIKIQSVFRMFRCLKAYRHHQAAVKIQHHFSATKIQSYFRSRLLRKKFLDQVRAIIKVQSVFRMFRCLKAYRHYQAAVKIQHHFSAKKIQRYFRSWLLRKKFLDQVRAIIKVQSVFRMFRCLKAYRHYQAAVKIQHHLSATKIQSYFRSWLLRKKFIDQIRVIIKIQSVFRKFICLKTYRHYQITTKSATLIQSFVRGWIVRREACSHRNFIVAIQRHCRGWLVRRDFLFQRDAAINIQSVIRSLKRQKTFNCEKEAAKEIQRFVRGHIIRNRLIGASRLHAAIPTGCILKRPTDCYCFQLKLFLYSVLKLQRWWRGVLLFKLRSKCALTIQSHIRGWIARQKAIRDRHHIAVIQSHWKGYLVRKESRGLLLDLRLRMQKSAQNVDDGRRIINRLLAALSELLNMKSVSVTLHTCATLDMTTRHSQRCCEELVGAGAIGTLLQLIRSVSRSIPDQEVSKHALSTLRNLCRYPHLLEMLIDSHGSVEIILWELLRNKEDGYFVASEILKKICSNRKGFEAIRKLPALLKRLSTLVDELTRKTINEKRNPRGLGPAIREHTERRLKDAAELLRLATSS